jgi:hypothetical protein
MLADRSRARTVAVARSSDVLSVVRQGAGLIQPTDPRDLALHLGDDAVSCVVIEAGAFDPATFDDIMNALYRSVSAASIVLCWDRGTPALRQVMQAMGAIRFLRPAHVRFTLREELARVASGRQLPWTTRAIRQLQVQSPVQRVEHPVMASIVISDVRRSVNDLAETLGTSPRALSRYCLQRNLPRPVALLGWARAVHIVGALECGDSSLEEIARQSGELSARDCSEYLRYHTGAAPTVWLRRGGSDALLEALAHRLGARPEIHHIGGRNSVTDRLNFVYREVGLAH